MTTETRLVHGKDEFFDMIIKLMQIYRTDDTLSHILVIAVHANQDGQCEEGDIVNAPVTFTHNLADNYEAAVLGNNVCAHIAVKEAKSMNEATRQ